MTEPRFVATVAVVDDDPDTRELLTFQLEGAGYRVVALSNGVDALSLLSDPRGAPVDLLIVDLMMPVMSGIEVIDAVRNENRAVPIMVLSGAHSEEVTIRALRLGADDFVTKPFSARELEARVQALLRRGDRTASCSAQSLVFDGLHIDVVSRRVWVRDAHVEFTAKEFDLLVHLASHPGRVFSRHQLLRAVWHSSSQWQQDGTVTEHVRRIRAKIEEDIERPKWIETVRGIGYRFERRRPSEPLVATEVARTLCVTS